MMAMEGSPHIRPTTVDVFLLVASSGLSGIHHEQLTHIAPIAALHRDDLEKYLNGDEADRVFSAVRCLQFTWSKQLDREQLALIIERQNHKLPIVFNGVEQKDHKPLLELDAPLNHLTINGVIVSISIQRQT